MNTMVMPYTLGGSPFHGPPSYEAPRQPTIYQCPPKSYTAGLRQVSEATIIAQSVQPRGEIPEEGRKKYINHIVVNFTYTQNTALSHAQFFAICMHNSY